MLFGGVFAAAGAYAQQGGIRGTVMDVDYEAPLSGVKVLVVETGQEAISGEGGNFYIEGVEPGSYTLMFSKDGYTRDSKADVVVSPGSLAEVESDLAGEYEDMDEMVVKEITLGGGSEISLLNIRFEAPAMMDSVGADLMSKAGASDAAQALALVPGTTIQDGKYAVVRGLPDRYVNSQMNRVRLPTADPDKRAVQLDQFPAAMIESVQVSKTFTPDQQGDASGGAVNIVLKGIPEEPVLKVKIGTKYKTNVADAGDQFLVDEGLSISTWGHDAESISADDENSWASSVGVARSDVPALYDLSVTAGNKVELGSDLKVGIIGSFFYKRDASYRENATRDSYWLFYRNNVYDSVLTPKSEVIKKNGRLNSGDTELTSLFSETKGTEALQWGVLTAVGAETENHALTLLYSYNFSAESSALLQEDAEGKYYYFPNYDIPDYTSSGGYEDADDDDENNSELAPFRRIEGLEYIERIANSLQLHGTHTFPVDALHLGSALTLKDIELNWTLAHSESRLNAPDRRVLGGYWFVDDNGDGVPVIAEVSDQYYDFSRKWRDIEESSDQLFGDVKLPFELWNGEEGYFKTGLFDDRVKRSYEEDTYYISGSSVSAFNYSTTADWNQYLSNLLSLDTVDMQKSLNDIDYDGEQNISALYCMADFPVTSFLKFAGGARLEKTEISTSIRNYNTGGVTFYESSSDYQSAVNIRPADANATINQSDVLPALEVEVKPLDKVVIRGSFTETLARMTFKELVPIQQQESIGGDIFLGNPDLEMSDVKNYDLRFDYNPYPGGLISFSWFKKDLENVIDYRQVLLGGAAIAIVPDNYPSGKINGYEFEVRQSLGEWWDSLDGLNLGCNFTLIDSELDASLEYASWQSYMDEIIAAEYDNGTRKMMGTPEYLYNFNATYTVPGTETELGLFYTVKGDSLIAAGTQKSGNYIPNIYETDSASLNFSLSQKLGENLKLEFKVKNILNPDVKTVYRSAYTGEDVDRTSYKKGVEYSIGLSGTW